jgi:hypothetical protein
MPRIIHRLQAILDNLRQRLPLPDLRQRLPPQDLAHQVAAAAVVVVEVVLLIVISQDIHLVLV